MITCLRVVPWPPARCLAWLPACVLGRAGMLPMCLGCVSTIYFFSSPVAGVLQLLPYFGLASLPMVLGTVFFINCNCLRAFASSVFFSYCDRFGLSLFPLVPSVISGKILFWDQVRYFGRPFYFGRTRGSWHPALPGSPQGGSGRPPCGPCCCSGAFQL